jgi:hypothetical protein
MLLDRRLDPLNPQAFAFALVVQVATRAGWPFLRTCA